MVTRRQIISTRRLYQALRNNDIDTIIEEINKGRTVSSIYIRNHINDVSFPVLELLAQEDAISNLNAIIDDETFLDYIVSNFINIWIDYDEASALRFFNRFEDLVFNLLYNGAEAEQEGYLTVVPPGTSEEIRERLHDILEMVKEGIEE